MLSVQPDREREWGPIHAQLRVVEVYVVQTEKNQLVEDQRKDRGKVGSIYQLVSTKKDLAGRARVEQLGVLEMVDATRQTAPIC